MLPRSDQLVHLRGRGRGWEVIERMKWECPCFLVRWVCGHWIDWFYVWKPWKKPHWWVISDRCLREGWNAKVNFPYHCGGPADEGWIGEVVGGDNLLWKVEHKNNIPICRLHDVPAVAVPARRTAPPPATTAYGRTRWALTTIHWNISLIGHSQKSWRHIAKL